MAAVSAGYPHETVHRHAASPTQPIPHYAVREIEHPTSYKPAYLNHDEEIRRPHETPRSDKIQGQYSLVDPDGKLRLINYHVKQRPRYSVPNHQHHRAPIVASNSHQPFIQSYSKPEQVSSLHTTAIAKSPVPHHVTHEMDRNPKYHSIPAIHSSRNDAPISYITISQLLPASYYGHKKVYTTSHASQHPY